MTRTIYASLFAALLALPALAKPAPKQGAPGGSYSYKVQKGDTLECFDSKYGIQPGELAALNGKPGKMTFKLVAGATIKTPLKVPAAGCAGVAVSGKEKGAQASMTDRACEVIDKTRKYTREQAIKALDRINHSPMCLKAISIASQPSVERLCEAFGTAMHAHHLTHSYATGVEMLCVSAHLLAHQIHGSSDHSSSHGATGHGAAPGTPAAH